MREVLHESFHEGVSNAMDKKVKNKRNRKYEEKLIVSVNTFANG